MSTPTIEKHDHKNEKAAVPAAASPAPKAERAPAPAAAQPADTGRKPRTPREPLRPLEFVRLSLNLLRRVAPEKREPALKKLEAAIKDDDGEGAG